MGSVPFGHYDRYREVPNEGGTQTPSLPPDLSTLIAQGL